MSAVEIKTEIAAPASEVYKALMDFPSYPDWNPMVVQISGTPTVGSNIEAHIKLGSRAAQTFKPEVLKNDPDREFRWVGTLFAAFLYRGEHYFIIEETAAGCVFTHGEKWSGILEPLITMMLKKDIEPSFKSFNDAIKQRVEGAKQG